VQHYKFWRHAQASWSLVAAEAPARA